MSARDPHSDPAESSIARAVEVIGDRWTVLILRDAFRGVRRFDELATDLGIARNLLADRLRRLVDQGVLQKVPYQERPTRYEYRLTPMGIDLSPALVALMLWGDKHRGGAEGPPLSLVHSTCGHELDQVFLCRHCGEEVTALGIRGRPGPGARPA